MEDPKTLQQQMNREKKVPESETDAQQKKQEMPPVSNQEKGAVGAVNAEPEEKTAPNSAAQTVGAATLKPIREEQAPKAPCEAAASEKILPELMKRFDAIEAKQKEMLDAVKKCGEASSKVLPATPENADKTDSLQKEMRELKDQNMNVLRELMNFVQGNGRQMNDELAKYHKLFENSAHDRIWKELAVVYRNLCAMAKSNPDLADDIEWDALEPMRELMEAYGVKVKETKPGEKRSLKSTHSKKQVAVGDSSLNGLVVKSLVPGFVRDDTVVLVPEEVETYVYDSSLEVQTAEEEPKEEQLPENREGAVCDTNGAASEEIAEVSDPESDAEKNETV